MNPIIDWQAAQACGDCGTDAAFIRQDNGAAICHECGHEHEMSPWHLDPHEEFTWVGGVLYVTCYAIPDEDD